MRKLLSLIGGVCLIHQAALAQDNKPTSTDLKPLSEDLHTRTAVWSIPLVFRDGVRLLHMDGKPFRGVFLTVHANKVKWRCAQFDCNHRDWITSATGLGGTAGLNFRYFGVRDWGVVIFQGGDDVRNILDSPSEVIMTLGMDVWVNVNDIAWMPIGTTTPPNYAYDDNNGEVQITITCKQSCN